MRTIARVATAVTAGLLTLGLAGTPATALRLVPDEHAATTSTDELPAGTSLLLSMGRVDAHTDASPDPIHEMVMSVGRLPR